MLEDIGDVDTKSTFLPWQNMAARKMEAGFQFESAIAERELAVWCGELHQLHDPLHSHPFSTLPCCPKPGSRPYHQATPTGRDPLRHTFDPLIEGSSWSKRLSLSRRKKTFLGM